MPSNTVSDPGVGGETWVTRQVTHDGDVAKLPGSFFVGIRGTEDNYTFDAIDGSAANGLEVDVTRVQGTVTVDNAGTFAVQAAIDELPAAAALTDDFANPTTTQIASMAMVWDGTTWDRAPGNAADGLLVNLGTNNDVTVAGMSTEAKQDTIIGHIDGVESSLANAVTALQIMDDWDETNRAKVNLIVGQAGVQGGSGAVSATTLRVVIASDQPALDVSAATVTVQGTVTANLSAVDNAVLDSIDAAVNGTLLVDGSAVTQPVSGTVTANLSATDNAVLDSIDAAVNAEPAYAIPDADADSSWSFAAASGGITDTTGVTAKTAAGAGIRNIVTRVQVINAHATVGTDVQIRDGASGTVLWRGYAVAAGGGVSAVFDPPLKGTANTLIEVACGTTGAEVYFNLQGYTST